MRVEVYDVRVLPTYLQYIPVANIATWSSHLILAFLFLSYGFYVCVMKKWNEFIIKDDNKTIRKKVCENLSRLTYKSSFILCY